MFKSDLKFGHKIEEEFASYLHSRKSPAIFNSTAAFDVEVGPFRYEVKADRRFPETHNLVVEFACRGKPSGINTTKANYYVFFIETHKQRRRCFHIISVKKLKRLIYNKKFKRIVAGGDNRASFMYLFSWDDIRDNFYSISEHIAEISQT